MTTKFTPTLPGTRSASAGLTLNNAGPASSEDLGAGLHTTTPSGFSILPTFAAASGAGLRDLMARMGHDSERAALIYQHEARGADAAITNAIDAHVDAERSRDDDQDGLPGALDPTG